MQIVNLRRNVAVSVMALTMCATPAWGSVGAITSPSIGAPTMNPVVALSIFGSQASAAALCGSSAITTASAAAVAQTPAVGCVLPVVDAPAPLPVVEAVEPQPVASSGFGVTPILLGLAGIAILAALILSQDNDNDRPVSVN